MYEVYETCDDYKPNQLEEIENWLDDNIGTEYETNEDYIMVFDLNTKEVSQLMKFENEFRKKYRMGKGVNYVQQA